MGFLKSSAGELVNCDNILAVTAEISATNLEVKVTSRVLAAANQQGSVFLETKLEYTSGAGNEMELTAGEYQKIFADAVASISEASGPAVILPTVNNKVTATGAIAGAVAPNVTYVLSDAIA